MIAKSEEKGLHLKSPKSFSMVFSKSATTSTCHVHGNILEQLQSSIYLGSLFSSDVRCEKEIKRRIGIAKSSFTKDNTDTQSTHINNMRETIIVTYKTITRTGSHCCEVMYLGCFGVRGEVGFLNCDDVCMCVVNKQFELLGFLFDSVYVDLQYDSSCSLDYTDKPDC